jgi:hypothetical protein
VSLLSKILRGLRLAPRDAEVIFDRGEPVGRPTDLVLPPRKNKGGKSVHAISPLKRVA